MRRTAPLAAALGFAALAPLLGCGPPAAERPPIVLVSIDTVRADRLPDWGHSAGRTPHLSRLVESGLRFANAYAQVPLTLPSHASLFTGRLPPEVNVRSNLGYRLDPGRQPSWVTALANAGYATGGFVSAYVLRRETGIGELFEHFDDRMPVPEDATLGALQRPGAETVAAAIAWLATVPRERPYVLFAHLFEPHFPYTPPPPFRDFEHPYDGEIAAADAALGELLAAVAARGDGERAVVVVLSDHGEGLGDHGEAEHGILLYREAIHVPLVLKLPGGRRAGETVAAPVGLVDLAPTLAALTGIEPPPGAAGRSLLGELAADRRIYSESLYPRLHLGWSELRSLVDGRWHAIEGPDPELYDVVVDPRERTNLRERERREYAARAADLAAIPLAFTAPAPASDEERAKLAALGYLSSSVETAPAALPDPKANLDRLVQIQRVLALTGERRYGEALDLCYRLLAENPDLIDVRNQLAGILRRLGRFDEALAVYDETVRRSPHLGEALAIERAKLELDLGRLDRAAALAAEALDRQPLEARWILSAVAGRRGDWETAVREARLGIGDPREPRVPALLLLTRALVEAGRIEEALSECERAVAADRRPGATPTATVDAAHGDVLARLGRLDEAEAAFRREIARFPGTREAYLNLAVLLAARHRFAEIEPLLADLVTADPTPGALLAAAETLERLGNRADAARYRRRAAAR